jgi:hypothetical protein
MKHVKLFEAFTNKDFTKFIMKAESHKDVIIFLEKTLYKLSEYHVTQNFSSLDVEIEFSARYSLDELLDIISDITDGHIMYRTLNYRENYTGKNIRDESSPI